MPTIQMPPKSRCGAPMKLLATSTVAAVTKAIAAIRNIPWWKSTGIRSFWAMRRQIQRLIMRLPATPTAPTLPSPRGGGELSTLPSPNGRGSIRPWLELPAGLGDGQNACMAVGGGGNGQAPEPPLRVESREELVYLLGEA